jgi:F-type H+-transporting ATPase subunit a
MLVRVVAATVLCALFALAARSVQLVPGRFQNVIEMVLDFIRVDIAQETLGANARRFVPFLTIVFVAVLAFNITGIVPLLNIASTALIGLPLMLAVWVYLLYLSVGIRTFGLRGYLKQNLFPAGVPAFLYVLITPIEALQVFVLRPATLALRLTANMISGHLILALAFAGTDYFLFAAHGALKGIFAVTFAASVGFTLFEAMIAVLQAYVFTLLSAVYLNMALEEEH